jgi:hypothetical protein
MSAQSPIFVKTQAFMVYLLNYTSKFPREERFRLAKRIEDALFNFHTSLMWAAQSNTPQEDLKAADVQLDLLRSYLRLSLELKHITGKQYAAIAEFTTEIGKLLGGWTKTIP